MSNVKPGAPKRRSEKGTKRPFPKVKGIFERDGVSWIRWHCTLGHEHREKVSPRGLAKEGTEPGGGRYGRPGGRGGRIARPWSNASGPSCSGTS